MQVLLVEKTILYVPLNLILKNAGSEIFVTAKQKRKAYSQTKIKFVPQIAYIENNKIQLDNITKELLENYSLS